MHFSSDNREGCEVRPEVTPVAYTGTLPDNERDGDVITPAGPSKPSKTTSIPSPIFPIVIKGFVKVDKKRKMINYVYF